MIDTDKYEGHTMTGLVFDEDSPNARLMADAPLLLAEVKRLREEVYNLTRANDTAWALSEVSEDEVKRLREGRLDLINEVVRIINNKTGERVDADLHDYIIDRLVNK